MGCNLAGPRWITGQLRRIRKLVREIATGAKRPRNDNSGVHTILTMACTDRQHCAGPGCPLPYNARVAALKKQAQGSTSLRRSLSKKSLRAFSPSCFQNCKISFCVFILQFCRCGGLLNAKGNPDGFLSHYLSLRNFRLSSFFDSLRRRGARPCAITFLFCFIASAAPAWPSAGRAGLLPDRSRPRRPAPSGRGRSRRGSEFPVRACRTSRRARRRTEDDARPRS